MLLDDCWGLRDPSTHRIEGDPDRFPEGMPAFIGKVQFGIGHNKRRRVVLNHRPKTSRVCRTTAGRGAARESRRFAPPMSAVRVVALSLSVAGACAWTALWTVHVQGASGEKCSTDKMKEWSDAVVFVRKSGAGPWGRCVRSSVSSGQK